MTSAFFYFLVKKKRKKAQKPYTLSVHFVHFCTHKVHIKYTFVYKCVHWNAVTLDTKPFWKFKKNIVFCQSGVTFFFWDSSGTAWHVNVLEQREKTSDARISLCSFLKKPKFHFFLILLFSFFFNFIFLDFFLHECNEFLKLRSDF